MTYLTWIYLFGAMVLLAAIPSASVALVVTRSAMGGFSRGAATSAGIVAGDLVFVWLALMGMSALAESLGSLFSVVRMLGGAYLIWIGVGLVRSKASVEIDVRGKRRIGLIECFGAGLLLTLGDVKAIVFYASFFPVMVDMTVLSATGMLWIVLITMVAVGGVKLIYAYAAERIVRRISARRLHTGGKRVAGALLALAGTHLIIGD